MSWISNSTESDKAVPKNWIVRHGCAVSLLGGGLLFFAAVVTLALSGPSMLNFDFYPLVWSPDSKYLAFGVQEGGKPNWKLFVVGADGDNLHKLVDKEELLDNEGEELYNFQWDSQSSKIYFTGFDGYSGNSVGDGLAYYVIDRDGKNLRRISKAEFPLASPPSDLSPDTGHVTECDKAARIETRVTHPSGLVAQSACLDPGLTLFECHQKLQVCNSATGKLVFTLDEHSVEGWLTRAAGFAGIVLLVGSGLMFTVGIVGLYRGMRARKRSHNSGG